MRNEQKNSQNLTGLPFWILGVLFTEPNGLHPYGIRISIHEATANMLTFKLPSVYESMKVLQEQGLVENTSSEIVNGRCQTIYKITSKGEKCLKQEYEKALKLIKHATKLVNH